MGTQAADAIVIGAGHNGLVAANNLVDAGWSVVVVEASGVPGGAVRSAEVTAPGFRNDLFSSFYPLGFASPALSALDLGEHGLRWRHAPDVLAHVFPDGRVARLHRDVAITAASLDEFAPGDGDRWEAAYAAWQQIADPLLRALLTPFPPVRATATLLRDQGVAEVLRLARRLVVPARALGREMFTGEGGPLLMAGCALHTDLSPDDAGGGFFGWLLAMLGQQVGWPVPEGGAQRITDALVSRLEQRGGRIVYGAPADRVLIARGRAMGVRAGGDLYRAHRAVLADVAAPALYLDLVGAAHLPPRLVEDLEHFRWDGSTVKVDWALSGRMPWRNPAAAGAGTVHLDADLRGLSHYAADLASGDLPARPFLLVGQMTTSDPSRSPAGTESLWAYTHLPFRTEWHGEEIAAHVEKMEGVLEEHAPGFRALVIGRHVAGPAELQGVNASLVGGALGGGTAAAYQQLFLRPVPGLGRPDTPIDRLFLASSSAHPGGGVHGAPGHNAARAALVRAGRAGAAYAAVVGAAHRTIYR